MARGRPPGTHCRRGHDYAVVGKKANGWCRQCAREAYEPTGVKPSPPRLFTDASARRIRRRVLSEGVAIDAIAEALGCSRRTIYEIVQGKRATYQEARI